MSPLNDINPNDIERIEIVKGAAAATLYGSEASAGVIHIFTKKGRTGAPTWTLQSDHGIEWVQPFGSRERPYIGLDPGSRRRMGRGTHSRDRKSTRLNSSHVAISYAVFCLKKKTDETLSADQY